MAKNQQSIIIKKVQGGGHGGHHGGAWKVAYADFMTAMMAFFMVMWLMGSDEETKSAIENYFNHPTSAWRNDLTSPENVPLGDMTGAGESILNGLGGAVAEDMVQRPNKIVKGEGEKLDKSPLDTLADETNPIRPESIRLAIREDQVFREGTLNQWTPAAEKFLTRLGKISKMYSGKIAIQGQYDPYSEGDKDTPGTYEHQLTRSVAIERYLIENHFAAEDRIKTEVIAARPDSKGEGRNVSSAERPPSGARAIEITISQ